MKKKYILCMCIAGGTFTVFNASYDPEAYHRRNRNEAKIGSTEKTIESNVIFPELDKIEQIEEKELLGTAQIPLPGGIEAASAKLGDEQTKRRELYFEINNNRTILVDNLSVLIEKSAKALCGITHKQKLEGGNDERKITLEFIADYMKFIKYYRDQLEKIILQAKNEGIIELWTNNLSETQYYTPIIDSDALWKIVEERCLESKISQEGSAGCCTVQ